MAYISYTDVPLYFSLGANVDLLPVGKADNQSRGVYCQQVQLNYTPNIAPVRLVGKKPTNDSFNLAGPPNSTLSFSAYIEGETTAHFDPTDYTGELGNVGTQFILGDRTNGISGSGAFMTSFSYTLTPYAPVLMQCDFAIYNPLTITSTGGNISSEADESMISGLDFGQYGHGVYSEFSGNADTKDATGVLSDMDIFESINYQFSANRLPIYKVGSYYLDAQELITAEQTLQIQGDNIQKLVSITGANPGEVNIMIKNSDFETLLTSTIDGRLNSENVSIAGGQLARGTISITELLK